jgi:hypothetical protein
LEIIDLLRDAFPDKKKFNTQAHGHRNLMIELPYDESTKSISSENLPLGEWVNLNAIIRSCMSTHNDPQTGLISSINYNPGNMMLKVYCESLWKLSQH